MKKKYSLQEAYKKRLIEPGEEINLSLLYQPYKSIMILEWGGITTYTLKDYFSSGMLGEFTTRLENNENVCVIEIEKRSDNQKLAELVTSKLLTDEAYGIKATCQKVTRSEYSGYHTLEHTHFLFRITVGPNIILRFDGEEEKPVLELPPHEAYTW